MWYAELKVPFATVSNHLASNAKSANEFRWILENSFVWSLFTPFPLEKESSHPALCGVEVNYRVLKIPLICLHGGLHPKRASKLQLIDFYFGLQSLLIKELLPCQVQINSAILRLGANASFQLARPIMQLFSIFVDDHFSALGYAC